MRVYFENKKGGGPHTQDPPPVLQIQLTRPRIRCTRKPTVGGGEKTSDRVSIALVGMGQVCREVLFELDKLCYFLRKWLKGCAIGVVCSLGTIAIKHLLDALIWVGLSGKPGTNRAFEGCLMG